MLLPSSAARLESRLRGVIWFLVGSAILAGGRRGTVWIDYFSNNLPQKPMLSVFMEQMDIISDIDLTFSSSPQGQCLCPHGSILLDAERQFRVTSRKPTLFPLGIWSRKKFLTWAPKNGVVVPQIQLWLCGTLAPTENNLVDTDLMWAFISHGGFFSSGNLASGWAFQWFVGGTERGTFWLFPHSAVREEMSSENFLFNLILGCCHQWYWTVGEWERWGRGKCSEVSGLGNISNF